LSTSRIERVSSHFITWNWRLVANGQILLISNYY
jgi:hypothetical protein